MAIDNAHLLALHGHPKLIGLMEGRELQAWPEIHSGMQTSSILTEAEMPPPIAIDRAGKRCAIADERGISILEFL